MPQKRTVFFVSDRTGMTTQMLGHSLLAQFDSVPMEEVTLPFVDSLERAKAAVDLINHREQADGIRPLVFSTIVSQEVAHAVSCARALYLDCCNVFMNALERELGVKASHTTSHSDRANDFSNRHARLEAINYALRHDHFRVPADFSGADIVVIGVERVGKTPLCLHLAVMHGVRAANYDLSVRDLEAGKLPDIVAAARGRIFGITMTPERLNITRTEHKKGRYASLEECRFELDKAETLMLREKIVFLDSSRTSLEELAALVMTQARPVQRVH